jgi:hypothetical protein
VSVFTRQKKRLELRNFDDFGAVVGKMGNLIGSFGGRNPSPAAPSRSSLAATGEVQQRQRKRGRKGGGGKEEGDSEEVEELSPRRKRIQTTSSYIYDTLFMKGVNADVSIAALGETSLLL